MMRFTAFLEIQLNPDMRDVGDISLYPLFPGQDTLICRCAKPTAIYGTHTHYTLTHGGYFQGEKSGSWILNLIHSASMKFIKSYQNSQKSIRFTAIH
jgi:hypothetical protein